MHDNKSLEQSTQDDGFLRRWAQRKARVQAQEQSESESPAETGAALRTDGVPDVTGAPPATGSSAPTPAATEAPLLTDADMPPLESLSQDSDFSPFFSKGVSEELRRTALRQLFRQPKFNTETNLPDFDDDYRNFQSLGDIVTCDMRHMQGVEARRAAEREAARQAILAEERAQQQAAAVTTAQPPALENSPAPASTVPELAASATPESDSSAAAADGTVASPDARPVAEHAQTELALAGHSHLQPDSDDKESR